MKWSKYNYELKSENGISMIYNSKTNRLIVVDSDQLYSMEKGIEESLAQNGFLVEDGANEFEELVSQIQKQNQDTSHLSVWIFVSNDCNLTCPYCWEKEGLLHKNSNMSTAVCQMTVEWIEKKILDGRVEELEITYMGGEPCLNLGAITDITLKLNQVIENVHYSIITNGVLLNDECIQKFMHLGIHSYQITLDGTREIHDRRRIYSNGTGTYEKILKNIMRVASMDEQSDIVIRVNVDEENASNVPKLLQILRRMDFQRFSALCVNDTICDDGIPKVEILNQVISILKIAKQLEFRIAYGELNNCWMMSDAWFMVNQDGLLYKCPSLVGMEQYAIGSVTEDQYYPEYEIQMSQTPWNKCKSCELLGLCQGGCPNRDRLATKSHRQCKVCKKQYMKELLKLKYSSEQGDRNEWN